MDLPHCRLRSKGVLRLQYPSFLARSLVVVQVLPRSADLQRVHVPMGNVLGKVHKLRAIAHDLSYRVKGEAVMPAGLREDRPNQKDMNVVLEEPARQRMRCVEPDKAGFREVPPVPAEVAVQSLIRKAFIEE